MAWVSPQQAQQAIERARTRIREAREITLLARDTRHLAALLREIARQARAHRIPAHENLPIRR